MAYIYEPRGKAREYGELALNLYNGCSHGCRYCYVPAATFSTREKMLLPRPRTINWDTLHKEMASVAGREIFLSFTCDPYQHLEEDLRITRRAIEAIRSHGCRVAILTKGGHRSEPDLDLLSSLHDFARYGATLTFLSDDDSSRWEPAAALPSTRLLVLEKAHSYGIPTWASLEPVIDPEQSLELIRVSSPFVKTYKVGKWNHDAAAGAIDWHSFASRAVELLESLGKQYYIKKDLAAYLPEKEVVNA